ncbi:MAG: hypothetical protein ACQESR_00790 [Planctomycetota bacterium]
MESCSTQAVLPLVGLAADKVIRERYNCGVFRRVAERAAKRVPSPKNGDRERRPVCRTIRRHVELRSYS